MDHVVISTELPEVAKLRSQLAAVEAQLDAASIAAQDWERKAMVVHDHPVVVALIAERDAAQAGQRRACEVIQNLLDSAWPHPVEHPTMFKAWREARSFLEGGSIAAVADTVHPLALSTERLLAELGVTEPGAGDANHEMPLATLMDKLYEAWNNYMRAKHGEADAIFEPEGE